MGDIPDRLSVIDKSDYSRVLRDYKELSPLDVDLSEVIVPMAHPEETRRTRKWWCRLARGARKGVQGRSSWEAIPRKHSDGITRSALKKNLLGSCRILLDIVYCPSHAYGPWCASSCGFRLRLPTLRQAWRSPFEQTCPVVLRVRRPLRRSHEEEDRRIAAWSPMTGINEAAREVNRKYCIAWFVGRWVDSGLSSGFVTWEYHVLLILCCLVGVFLPQVSSAADRKRIAADTTLQGIKCMHAHFGGTSLPLHTFRSTLCLATASLLVLRGSSQCCLQSCSANASCKRRSSKHSGSMDSKISNSLWRSMQMKQELSRASCKDGFGVDRAPHASRVPKKNWLLDFLRRRLSMSLALQKKTSQWRFRTGKT